MMDGLIKSYSSPLTNSLQKAKIKLSIIVFEFSNCGDGIIALWETLAAQMKSWCSSRMFFVPLWTLCNSVEWLLLWENKKNMKYHQYMLMMDIFYHDSLPFSRCFLIIKAYDKECVFLDGDPLQNFFDQKARQDILFLLTTSRFQEIWLPYFCLFVQLANLYSFIKHARKWFFWTPALIWQIAWRCLTAGQ